MEFLVFRRTDSALLVVPAMFQPPLACGSPRDLQTLGRCDLDLDAFSPRIVADLGLQGFALIEDRDLEVLRSQLNVEPLIQSSSTDGLQELA